MKNKITKKQVAALGILYYIARKTADNLVKEKEKADARAIDSIVGNKVLEQTSKLEKEGEDN